MAISTIQSTGLPSNVYAIYTTSTGVASPIECQGKGWGRLEIDIPTGTVTGTLGIQTRMAETLAWKTQAFIPLSASGQGTFQTSITTWSNRIFDIPLRGAVQVQATVTSIVGTFSAHLALDGAGY